jgi:hypothetical protein
MVFRFGSSTSYPNIPLGKKTPTALVTIYPYSSHHGRSGHDSSRHTYELHLLGNCQVSFVPILSNISFIFNFLIKRRWSGWWTKYNYVLVRSSLTYLIVSLRVSTLVWQSVPSSYFSYDKVPESIDF